MGECYSPQCVRLTVGSRRQQEDSSWRSFYRLWHTIDAIYLEASAHTLQSKPEMDAHNHPSIRCLNAVDLYADQEPC